MKRWVLFFLIGILVTGLIGFHFSAFVYAKEVPLEKRVVSFDFKDIDLKDAIKLISIRTGINVVIDPDVKGKVTARVEKPVPVLKALSAILSPYGFTYLREDGLIRVVKKPVELKKKTFTLKYALAEGILPLIKDFLSENGEAKVDASLNLISVSDLEENLEKIEKIIKEQDTLTSQLKKKTFTLKYAVAEDMVPLVKDFLSENGSLQLDKSSNSLLIQDTSLNLSSLEKLLASLDVFSPSEEVFTLKYALAEDILPSCKRYLSEKGKIDIVKDKNQIIVFDAPFPLSKVKNFIKKVDSFSLQKKEASFKVKYLYPEKLALILKDYLSPQGKIEVDSEKGEIKITDAAYPLSLIKERVEKEDVFSPERKIFKLNFASAKILSYKVQDLLSDKGEVEVDEASNSLIVIDAKKFLDKIPPLIEKEDKIENQLVTRRYELLYLSPQEAKAILDLVVSEFGKITFDAPQIGEKEKNEESEEIDIIKIPFEGQSKDKDKEKEKNRGSLSSISFPDLHSVVFVTDLKRNFPKIEEVINNLNSEEWASRPVTYTFYVKEGSVERMALTIASILGIPPDNIEGLQLKKGGWIEMKLSSPSIDLGNIGAIGKK